MTKKAIEDAERRISLASKKVKIEHLEYWMCLAAARGKGTESSLTESPVLRTELDELEPTRGL